MDADKISRSGRKVKTPHKFQDMEVVDPITGRRTITNSPLPTIPKVKPVYTGRKRGRPPRNSASGISPIPTEGLFEHDHPSHSEEDSLEGAYSGVFPVTAGQTGAEDNSGSSAADLIDAQSGINQSMTAQPHSASADGVSIDPGAAVLTKHSYSLASAAGSTVAQGGIRNGAAGVIGIPKRPKRPRKKPISPDEGGPSKRRRGGSDSKNYEGHVDIPEGLLEAMRKKRQVTAYLVFCRSERPAVIRDFPEGDFSQFSKELGNRWTALSEEEKVRWRRIASQITQTLQAERDPGAEQPERSRKTRDKIIRDLDARVIEPPSNSAFDLVANLSIVGEQLGNMANCVNFVSFTPGSLEPVGCLDAVMDSALVLISSTLGLMAQMPVIRDSLDVDIFDDLAENSGMIMPLVHFK